MLSKYADLVRKQHNVTFLGRLGTYRYLDMDVTIGEALNISVEVINCIRNGQTIAPLYTSI